MRKILKNKRGIAMESALLFMTVVTCLCMLLTTGMALLHTSVKTDVKQYQNRLALDQIGEYFVADEKNAMNALIAEKGYSAEINNENNTLTIVNANGKVILYVVKDGKQAKVWRYSAPKQN